MVIAEPGFEGGKVCVWYHCYLPRTLVKCAGIRPFDGVQGRNLKTVDGGEWEDVALMQISESHVGRAIRTKRWIYEVGAVGKDGWKTEGSTSYMEVFLCGNEKDPHQKIHLAANPAYAQVRAELAEQLKKAMVQAGEEIPEILPFADNGYLEEFSAVSKF